MFGTFPLILSQFPPGLRGMTAKRYPVYNSGPLSREHVILIPMSSFLPGDVILVPFPFTGETGAKLRPALVIALAESGDPVCCPVRSSERAGACCIPISIDDFVAGGLDLFSVSFVQADTVRTVRAGSIVAKKGRVNKDYLAGIERVVRR